MRVTVVTPPAAEPVTLAEALIHLREQVLDDDPDKVAIEADVTRKIKAAVRWCERFQGRRYITQTLKRTLDGFPANGRIVLPYPPLQSVESITYVDPDGVTQTLSADSYDVDTTRSPGLVALAYGASWPSIRTQLAAVEVTYVVGYGASGSSVPEDWLSAVLLRLSDLWEHREASVVGTIFTNTKAAEALLMPGRVIAVE